MTKQEIINDSIVAINEWIGDSNARDMDWTKEVKAVIKDTLKQGITKKEVLISLKKNFKENEYWTTGEMRRVLELLK